MFTYRDEYYLAREQPDDDDPEAVMKWQAKMDNAVGKAEVLIQKQHHGPIGLVMLSFTPELTKFGNLAQDDGGGYTGF